MWIPRILASATAAVGIERLVVQLVRKRVSRCKADALGEPVLEVHLQAVVARCAIEVLIANASKGVIRPSALNDH